MARRVSFHTLGCKVNQYDTAALKERFRAAGYTVVPWQEEADVYVINSCTVTGVGEQKSRQAVRRARRLNPRAVVVLTGCYPQSDPRRAEELEGVSVVVGTRDQGRILDLVERALAEKERGGEPFFSAVLPHEPGEEFEECGLVPLHERTRAVLKVQEGCEQFCSYCRVPYARGPERSRSPEKVVAEARAALDSGFQELVLTGINLGAYGRDLKGRWAGFTLAGLVRHLLKELPELRRLRLSSVEPTEITPEIIEVLAEEQRVCRHLHIPLQSGSDAILRRMNRRYRSDEYARLVGVVRERLPELALTTDVMVGFPGEREEDFAATQRLVEELAFSRLHVFRYSRRPGTPAAGFPDQVPERVKEERSRILIELGERLSRRFQERFLGRVCTVLFEESPRPGWQEGLTEHYIRVAVKTEQNLTGRLCPVLLKESRGSEVMGELVPEKAGIV